MDGRRSPDEENERFDWPVVSFHLAPMGGRVTTPVPVARSFHWPVVDCKRKDWTMARGGTLSKGREQGAGWLGCLVYGDGRSIRLSIW